MEQIVYSGMMAMLQAAPQQQSVQRPAEKAEQEGEPSQFQKLMEERAKPAPRAEKPAEGAEQPRQTEQAPEQPQKKPQEGDEGQKLVQEMIQAGLAAVELNAVQAPQAPVQRGSAAPETAVQPTGASLEGQPAAASQGEAALPVQTAAQAQTSSGGEERAAQTQAQPQTEQGRAAQTQVQPRQEAQTQPAERQDRQVEQGKQARPEGEARKSELEVTGAQQAPKPVFQDVEAAPIKVGEAPAMEQEGKAPAVDRQLADQLARSLEQGESKVEIQLAPANLGVVKVEIVRQESGALQVILSAESSQTQSLLEKHTGSLQSLLAGSGQENVQVQVQRQEESQQNDPYYDGRQGRDQSGREDRQEQDRRQNRHSQDFLQQLRLGLIPLEEVS